jgi:hypothetical protein
MMACPIGWTSERFPEVGGFVSDGNVLKKNDLEAGGAWGIGLFWNARQAPIERHAGISFC